MAVHLPADLTPRVGDAATDAMRAYVDHSRDVGTYHPAFPVYALRCADDRGEGEVTFPLVYEGPPGVVHGGFLALFFDCVLQQLNCDMGLAGKTTRLALRYRRPTPIDRPLRVVAHRTVDDDRIHSEAQLLDGDELLCSAEMSAFAGNRANLPAVSPRRLGVTTVGAVLAARAEDRPDHDFVVCDDERLTYGDADRASRELARGLIGVGVGRGAHVALCYPTGVDFVVAWLACARIGAVTVPISTFSTADEIATLLRNADVRAVLTVPAYRGNDFVGALTRAVPALDLARPEPVFATAAPHLRRVFVVGGAAGVDQFHTGAALTAAAATVEPGLVDRVGAEVGADDRMVIVHTSGSTSAPKGVVHTHGGLCDHLAVLNEVRGLTADMRMFSNSPMFWIGGMGYNLVGTLMAGSTLVCSRAEDPARTLDLIERERPEMVNGFAQSVAVLVSDPSFPDRDFSFIRTGNLYPLMPERMQPADLELRHNLLGMTETGSVALMDADESDQPEHRRGSFGRPVADLEARVVDLDTGAECAPGELGELWFRGPNLMEGYYGRERHEVFTPDGWFRTGDACTTDTEGYLYFRGRRGDMIKTAGANVSPREVEPVLREVTGCEYAIVLRAPRRRAWADRRRGAGGGAGRDGRRDAPPRAARPALGLQGPAPVPAPVPHGRPDAVERQARRARGPGDVRMTGTPDAPGPTERCSIPALLRRRAAETGDARFLVTDDDVLTYADLDARTRAVADTIVRGGAGKGSRVGLLMPNGIDWAVLALGIMRAGAVLVPLSTFLRPPELRAQLVTAGIEHLVMVPAFRDHDYVADLGAIAADVPRLRGATVRADLLAAAADVRRDDRRVRRRARRRGAPRRRHGGDLHLGQPGRAQGRDPHPRRRARRGGGVARAPVHRSRRPHVHPDAVLLDGRLRRRAALGARGGRDPHHRGRARAHPHARAAGTRAGHPVPRLARPGRGARRPSRPSPPPISRR